MPLLRLVDVGVDLADRPLFDDVRLHVPPGRRVALVGETFALALVSSTRTRRLQFPHEDVVIG